MEAIGLLLIPKISIFAFQNILIRIMKFWLLFLLTIIAANTHLKAQGLSGKLVEFGFSKSQVSNCDVAREKSYYTEEEKDLFLLINIFRQYPKYLGNNLDRFCKVFCTDEGYYIPSFVGGEYYEELKSYLLSLKSLPMFIPDISLFNSSKDHAIDAGTNGFTGHVSSNGDNVVTRVLKYNKKYNYIGECCDYGYKCAPNILIHLLVDDGVVSRGHRLAILDNGKYGYNIIGISIQPHKVWKWNTVIDFTNTNY
jgi:hypothetical protein